MFLNLERIANLSLEFFLLLSEYFIKLSAILVTAVTIAAEGTFLNKIITGFGSISSSLRNLFEAPSDITQAAIVIEDYNTLTASAFENQHGAEAIQTVFANLHGEAVYTESLFENFTLNPFATIFAALIAFGSLYIASLVLRFARLKGRRSWLNRLEFKMGKRVFEEIEPQTESKPHPKPRLVKSSVSPRIKKTDVNSQLQEYFKVAQSG